MTTRSSRTDWQPAMMIPTAWACLCPVCGRETEIEGVQASGDLARRNEVYRVGGEHDDRWIRCDECDTGLEILPAIVSHPPAGGL